MIVDKCNYCGAKIPLTQYPGRCEECDVRMKALGDKLFGK